MLSRRSSHGYDEIAKFVEIVCGALANRASAHSEQEETLVRYKEERVFFRNRNRILALITCLRNQTNADKREEIWNFPSI